MKLEDLTVGTDEPRKITIEKTSQAKKIPSKKETQKRESQDTIWETRFQDLLIYYQTKGDFRVPRSYTTDKGSKLGEWVHSQRFSYKKKKPFFMKERAGKLDAVGFGKYRAFFVTVSRVILIEKHLHSFLIYRVGTAVKRLCT